ncbi:MAG: ABC transporter ATP-binding protein [Rickettsiaceae bacterium]|nr:MAG: ABC transporter ATP-binding protein [Rickettsiaceae bacterium]
MNKDNILVLEDISKQYFQGGMVNEILKNINLTVQSGQLITIVGDSGSGKSTLLHIAGLLDKADSGEIRICNKNPRYNSKDNIRLNHIGFIYQNHYLLRNFTAIENVAMPKIIAGEQKSKAFKAASDLLFELGLSKRLHNFPGELSGGEQQRVAIARSLINNPQLVLADEPTGNLDPETAQEVFELFVKVVNTHNTSVIMVTHNHVLAAKADKTYRLQYGLLQA